MRGGCCLSRIFWLRSLFGQFIFLFIGGWNPFFRGVVVCVDEILESSSKVNKGVSWRGVHVFSILEEKICGIDEAHLLLLL